MNPFASIPDLFRMYDRRAFAELSNDQSSSVLNPTVLQSLLDMQASELESYLYGRVALPINPPLTYASGGAAFTVVPADLSTITIPNGTITKTFTFLSGGTGASQINTASGNTATIAGLLATAINASSLKMFAQASGIFVQVVNEVGGTVGNVAIATTSAIGVKGMSGGTTQMPLVLTKWVCATAARRLFARRSDLPDAVKADSEWADQWIGMFIDAKVQIPEIPPAVMPTLQDSDFFNGASEFDYVFDTLPPRAPQSANPGYQPNSLPCPQ